MDVFEAVRTVLAVRRYRDKPVPEEVVWRIVEAGRLSASASNLQPWHFVVVQDRETLRQIASRARTGPYIAGAPLALVVAVERTRFGVSDGSRAIQSMMLTAWAEGVGSNWVGFGGLEEIRTLLNIPAEFDVLAVIPRLPGPARRVRQEEAQAAGGGRKPRAVRSAVPVGRTTAVKATCCRRDSPNRPGKPRSL